MTPSQFEVLREINNVLHQHGVPVPRLLFDTLRKHVKQHCRQYESAEQDLADCPAHPGEKEIPEFNTQLELEHEMKCNQMATSRRGVTDPNVVSRMLEKELEKWKARYNNMKNRAHRAERHANRAIQSSTAGAPRTPADRAAAPKLHIAQKHIHMIQLAALGLDKPHSHPRPLRTLVWENYKLPTGDRIMCCHCGKLHTFETFTIEHLNPRVLGGTDDIRNLRAACDLCNQMRPVENIYDRFNPPVSHP